MEDGEQVMKRRIVKERNIGVNKGGGSAVWTDVGLCVCDKWKKHQERLHHSATD